jgi:hypothetical protein
MSEYLNMRPEIAFNLNVPIITNVNVYVECNGNLLDSIDLILSRVDQISQNPLQRPTLILKSRNKFLLLN